MGTEPRGCALTPNGQLLYVANHTEGTVSIVDTASRDAVGTVTLPVLSGSSTANPTAIAITNNGNANDGDETVFVTQIFAELDPDFVDPNLKGVGGEMRDLGKRGVVHAFQAGNPNPAITKITLLPLADSGFSASRIELLPEHAPRPDIRSAGLLPGPDPTARCPGKRNQPAGGVPQPTPVSVDSRQPPVSAQHRRPARASGGSHRERAGARLGRGRRVALAEVVTERVNLNQQIDVETAAPPPSLDRTFGNDIVAIDANLAGNTFVIVSRGPGSRCSAPHSMADRKLNILNAAGSRVDCRLQTGNLPSGVAMRKDGTRAYANNEANFPSHP